MKEITGYKVFIFGELLDVVTTGYGLGRCFLTPSCDNVKENECLRINSVFKYNVSRKNATDYFINKLFSQKYIDNESTADEISKLLKSCYIFRSSDQISASISHSGIKDEIEVELCIYNSDEDIKYGMDREIFLLELIKF